MRLLKLPLSISNQQTLPLPLPSLNRLQPCRRHKLSIRCFRTVRNLKSVPYASLFQTLRDLHPPRPLPYLLFVTSSDSYTSTLFCSQRAHAATGPSPMSRSQSQVAALVPLNDQHEKEESAPELVISEGDNVIGRSDIPVTDKRLSRKQLTLSAFDDGTAELVAAGTNPVVVHMGYEKKRLSLGEKVRVNNGAVIELIPGEYFFKYVSAEKHAFAKEEDGRVSDERKNDVGVGVKRWQREPNEAVATSSEAKCRTENSSHGGTYSQPKRQNVSGSRNTTEAISQFHVSDEKLPMTFRLMRVNGLPQWANTSCVSIGDVIQGDVRVAILSNYMVDIDWLLSACPQLKKVPHVLVIHGEGDGTLEHMKRSMPSNWILHKPPLPISYGTHHSKAMLLVYPCGVRVIVHTANLIHVDWNYKSQGLWMQDFPWKGQSDSSGSCGFENDLIDYLNALKLPELTANLPAHGNVKINSSFFKKFNYGDAMVRLIASVPGYHSGPNLKKWGHMKLRSILEQCVFDKEFKKAPLIYQFSSLGSLDEKWMAELKSSMSAGSSDDKSPLGLGEPLIIWPTVEDVRCSLEGYAAGNAIPGPLKNVEKAFLKKYWAKWKARHTGRCRAMPHIKTFTRYSGQNLAWFLLTSSNLSKAAWGALQKNNSQLMIRSYELGVLFLPSNIKNSCRFSCTNEAKNGKDKVDSLEKSENQRTKLVTLTWQGSENIDPDTEFIQLPVPYELPPPLYSPEDVPWCWDRRYPKKDVYGQVR